MALPRDVVILSDEQFGKLVELLTPGYECAKLMLADYQRQADERARYVHEEPADEPVVDERTPEQIAADAAGRHNGLE